MLGREERFEIPKRVNTAAAMPPSDSCNAIAFRCHP